MSAGRQTQRAKLLELLVAARGNWVGLPDILRLGIAQYNSRLLDLRRLGFTIENRIQNTNGVKHSWFRLVMKPAPRAPSPALPSTGNNPATNHSAATLPLFAEGGR